ncbi:MAG TPA: VOC family protein [Dehalococcoidia bacterium]|nr:VOC family protein [Dehalococcoidia bacterium]
MASISQLGYVGVGASDLEQWDRFATSVLGMQVYKRGADGTLFLRMDEYHHRIAVHPTGTDDVAYVGWGVPNKEALVELAGQLRAAGVQVSEGTREEARARHVMELIKLQDPNGIPLEVFYGLEACYPDPFNSPRPISGFVTGEQGLGHVVFSADDLEESLHFYRDLLGLRITDYMLREGGDGDEILMAFLHCNPRHHSIAFSTMRRQRRMSHIMLQLKEMDDVGLTYDLCKDQEVPIAMSLGKHMNDHMLSFYVVTPSGFMIEYGWGGRTVDDDTWQVQVHTQGDIWGHRLASGQQALRQMAGRS